MIDETTEKGRVIAAAMRLAAGKPWKDVSLLDVAEAAGMRLVDLKAHFASKGDVLTAFSRAIDDDTLRRIPVRTAGTTQAPRDALFDVVMSRFDALAPYRGALKSIAAAGAADPMLVRSFLTSQHWMLQASGVNTDGLGGCVRLAGLSSVYASVFQTWLEDDDPGLARTMAALDRRLRSGERTLRLVDDVIGFAERIAGLLTPLKGAGRRARDRRADGPAAGAATMPGAGGATQV
jgi:AcrR family transcriptional regulator